MLLFSIVVFLSVFYVLLKGSFASRNQYMNKFLKQIQNVICLGFLYTDKLNVCIIVAFCKESDGIFVLEVVFSTVNFRLFS